MVVIRDKPAVIEAALALGRVCHYSSQKMNTIMCLVFGGIDNSFVAIVMLSS